MITKLNGLIQRFSSSWIGAVSAIIMFLIMVNLASQQIFMRLDLSEGNIYSLSKATKKMVRELADPVIVKCYFSKGLAQPYSSHKDYLRDILRSYKSYGGSNFEYEFAHDPDPEVFKRKAIKAGVAPVRLTVIAKDKYEVKEGFMGLVVLFGDKKETIPLIRNIDGIEYDITSRIKKMTMETTSSIGSIKGKGNEDLPDGIKGNILERYKIEEIYLADKTSIPDDMKALLVLGPQEKFNDHEKALIEQQVLKGIPTAFFVDTKKVDIESGMFSVRDIALDLNPLFLKWGINIKPAVVLDAQSQNVSIQQQMMGFLMNTIVSYPLFPIVTNMDEVNPITKELDQIVFPFAAPISTSPVKGIEHTVLVRSTRQSWSKDKLFNASPLAKHMNPSRNDPLGPFSMAVIAQGKFDALYTEPPQASTSTASSLPSDWLARTKNISRVIVCSTSRLIDPRLPISQSNQTFFLNALDWLTQDDALIAIRSKGAKLRPFTWAPEYASRQAIKLSSILLMPILTMLAGVGRWQYRKRWKRKIVKKFI
ncbi:GldG family protein [Elusimicrobiota bacterium]